jgi:hypothetical protein
MIDALLSVLRVIAWIWAVGATACVLLMLALCALAPVLSRSERSARRRRDDSALYLDSDTRTLQLCDGDEAEFLRLLRAEERRGAAILQRERSLWESC